MTTPLSKLTQIVSVSKKILIFTGAGISTESGISDYRSKGGLWDRFQPVTIQEFLSSVDKRKQYWSQKLELYESFKIAKPNDGHMAIFELEKHGSLKGIVTQNIDGLHQQAGNSSKRILEIHGTNRETICLSCGDITLWEDTFERLKAGEEAPKCLKCEGFLKPNTISFGQNLNQETLELAVQWAYDCDLILAVGSTLVVEPAASLPRIAKQKAGAWFAIITMSETPLDSLADVKIEAPAGETLKEIMQSLN